MVRVNGLSGMMVALATLALAQGRAALVHAQSPAAQEPQEPASFFHQPESRELARHRYIPPVLQQSAFVTTHFGVRQGFESLVVPDVALDFGKDELQANGFTQAFDLGLKLANFVGLYGSASGSVTSGTNAASAFEIGADLEASFELGAVLRVARFEPLGTQLALRGWGGFALENDYNIAQLVENAQEATVGAVRSIRGSDALALLVTPSQAKRFGGSLHIAQTLLPTLGLQAALGFHKKLAVSKPFELNQRKRVRETADESVLELGLALSLDGRSLGVPLALMPEYRLVHKSVHAEDDRGDTLDLDYNSHYAGGGLYYSGRDNLVLGLAAFAALNLEQDRLEWNASDGSPRASGIPSAWHLDFVLRYVW